jgi:type IV pilus biogenesis protein CpaD/CtpE
MNRLILLAALSLTLNACGYKLVKEVENPPTPVDTNSPVVKTEVSKPVAVKNQTQKVCNIKVKSSTPADKLIVTYNPAKDRSFLDRKGAANSNSLMITQNVKGCDKVKLTTGQILEVKTIDSFR